MLVGLCVQVLLWPLAGVVLGSPCLLPVRIFNHLKIHFHVSLFVSIGPEKPCYSRRGEGSIKI